jgi:hypothetical protein
VAAGAQLSVNAEEVGKKCRADKPNSGNSATMPHALEAWLNIDSTTDLCPSKAATMRFFTTYSCYSRGVDMLNSAYHYLDLVPKGRDEDQLEFSQSWVRYHDKYED